MKAVVTGGAGFIGSNLAHALVGDADVDEVHVVDDLSTGHRENVPGEATLHVGSVLDRDLLARVFEGAGVVYHQAALPSVPRSVEDPLGSHAANATGTLHVLLAARDAGVEKVVYAASSSAYGDAPTLPKHEGMPPRPISPYAAAKLAGEEYCRAFHAVYGLRTTSLRYFNVYGPRQDPQGAYAAVVPRFVQAALAGRPLTVYGDGAQTRDFTFVGDAVAANLLAARSTRADGEVVNVGSGQRVTVRHLAERILALAGSSSRIEQAPPRPGDIRDSLADVALAGDLIGYTPAVPPEEGLERTVAWFRDQTVPAVGGEGA